MSSIPASLRLMIPLAAILAAGCSKTPQSPTAPEPSAPVVEQTVPAGGAQEVSTVTDIVVRFSKAVDPASVRMLVEGVERGALHVDGEVATLTLSRRLLQAVEYTVTLLPGVRDLEGGAVANAFQWSFTTGFGPLGEEWQAIRSGVPGRLHDVTRGSVEYLAVGEQGAMVRSQDGYDWQPVAFTPAAEDLRAVKAIGDRFMATASPSRIVAMTHPQTWEEFDLPSELQQAYDIALTTDAAYLVGTGGAGGTEGLVVRYGGPGMSEVASLGENTTPRSIARFGQGLIVVGDRGLVLTSTDGSRWEDRSLGPNAGSLRKVRWDMQADRLFAVGAGIFTSSDGIRWQRVGPAGLPMLNDLIWTRIHSGSSVHTLYCAVGNEGTILTSADGETWQRQDSGTDVDLLGVTRGSVGLTQFVAVGDRGQILISE